MTCVLALLLSAAVSMIPTVHESERDGVFVVDGEFALQAPIDRAQAFNVLADYGHLKEFVSSIEKSEVRGRSTNGAVVEQEARGKWLFFSRTVDVLLDVQEVSNRSIAFHDVSHKDFVSYLGSWKLREQAGEVLVDYHLEAKPSASLPAFVVKKVIADDAAGLLAQLRAEIVRRATMAANNGSRLNLK